MAGPDDLPFTGLEELIGSGVTVAVVQEVSEVSTGAFSDEQLGSDAASNTAQAQVRGGEGTAVAGGHAESKGGRRLLIRGL